MTIKIPLILLPIDNYDGVHLMIHCKVNNLKANFLVDTGASRTVFDLKRIKHYHPEAKLKKNNKIFTGIGAVNIETLLTNIPILSIGENHFREYTIVLFDLNIINQSYAVYDLPRIDGVLGGDILKSCNTIIDYKNKLLILEKIT